MKIFSRLVALSILALVVSGCQSFRPLDLFGSKAVAAEFTSMPAETGVDVVRLALAPIAKEQNRLSDVAAAATPAFVLPQPVAPVVNVAPAQVTVSPAQVTVAPATVASFSWGLVLQETLASLVPTLTSVLLGLLALVKGPAGVMLRLWFTEKKVAELVGYAVNMTAGAVRDRVLTVDVGNEVLANVLNRVNELPRWVVKWMGGPEAIRQSVIAKLNLDESASSETVYVK